MALQGLFCALMQGRAMAGKRGKNGRDSANLQAGGKKWQIVTKDGSSCPSRRKQVAVRKLFTKSSQRSLDDKGRLMLPAAFREALTAESGGTFWLTCLYGRLVACVGKMMPWFLTGMTVFGLQRACQNTFIALGQARISLFIALLRKVFLLVPLALTLPRIFGVEGVYLAESVADATAAICCISIFMVFFPKILAKGCNKF